MLQLVLNSQVMLKMLIIPWDGGCVILEPKSNTPNGGEVKVMGRIGGRVFRGIWRPNPKSESKNVAVKLAIGASDVSSLMMEGFWYSRMSETRVAVPDFYGLFAGKYASREFACLMMELCAPDPIQDMENISRQKMLLACHLHDNDLSHGHLTDEHFVVQGQAVKMISLSELRKHYCAGCFPRLFSEAPGGVPKGCIELWQMERQYWALTADLTAAIANGL
ncbi:hypothetical protein JAAARDRAFT_202645 [Jaapia argillacea MUCL 33604]|uniref:Protein kinase domain-containing protein n=1 Tax=Jaapia argillacea MUCL 33604 TaxID=933084 RepID=A0A067QAD7_9AGAM|nr:hypothetical protein JAAARDRAFT_202645 [Jaapia argillacea MUCL 33604]